MCTIKGGDIVAVQSMRNILIAATFAGVLAYTAGSNAMENIAKVRTNNDLSASDVRNLLLAICLLASFLSFALSVRAAVFIGWIINTSVVLSPEQEQILRTSNSEHKRDKQEIINTTSIYSSNNISDDDYKTNGYTGSNIIHKQDMYDQQIGQGKHNPLPTSHIQSTTSSASSPSIPDSSEDINFVDLQKIIEQQGYTMALHFSLGFRAFYLAIPIVIAAAGSIPFIVATCIILLWLLYVDNDGLS